jgi:hypothetical protein
MGVRLQEQLQKPVFLCLSGPPTRQEKPRQVGDLAGTEDFQLGTGNLYFG